MSPARRGRPTTRPRTRSTALLVVLLLAVVLGGCARGQDDELRPRPVRTVTVTPSPTLTPPAGIPLGGAELAGEVVWAEGTDLHVGDRVVDLTPVRVEQLVATSSGAYVLARNEVWSVDLRRARGTGLPTVERLGLSRDGRTLLVDLAGDRVRRAYDLATGGLREGPAPAALTDAVQRAGPGEYAVRAGPDGSPQVTAPDGSPVRVAGLPEQLEPRTWPTASTVAGLATAADGTSSVVSCTLGDDARCASLGAVSDPRQVVFAVAPLPR